MKSVFTLLLAIAPAVLSFVPQKAVVTTSLWGVPPLSSRQDSRVFAESIESSEKRPTNIIIAGAPASGKGTQCEIIKEKFGVVHLSTGDMLRAAVAAQTEVGKLAKDFMDSGKLVPDEVIIGVVRSIGGLDYYCTSLYDIIICLDMFVGVLLFPASFASA
jgi:hypothetical protein